LSFYVGMNLLFAFLYYAVGVEQLSGLRGDSEFMRWLYCFFFSVQCYTTVGFGGIHPIGITANFIAAFESFAGLMTFAISTGSLYGRFSRPVARIKYSDAVIIAPHKEGTGMQFMVASELNSVLMEMEATVTLSWNDLNENHQPIRMYQQIKFLCFQQVGLLTTLSTRKAYCITEHSRR
jgi:inward rectifier potassium channel